MQSRNQILLFVLFWITLGGVILKVVPADSFTSQNEKTSVTAVSPITPAKVNESPAPSAAIQSITAASPPVVRVDEPTRVIGELRGDDVFVVTAVMLTVRSKPNRYSPRVRYLQRGDRVVRISQKGRWVKIGHNEYISSTYLRPMRNIAHH